jgi:hypothetical protein
MGTISIPLTQGKYALIDEEDFALVSQYKWHSCRGHTRNRAVWYAKRNIRLENGKQTTVLLHRFLLDAPKELEVDHINGDGLDNRRANLRFATRSENCRNRWTTWGASSYRGVTRDAQNQKWRADIKVNGRRISLGAFATEEEAARAYDSAAIVLHGEFARTNRSISGDEQ